MKTKFDLRSLLCGALVGAAVVLLTAAAAREQPNEGWEYSVHYYARGNQAPVPELNRLGEQGWEVAAALAGAEGVTHGFIFKRPAPRRVRE